MKRWKFWLAGFALLFALGVFVLLTRRPEAPIPNPPGSFSFAVLGDAPYDVFEERQYPRVLQALEANDLSMVIHVGDIFWRPCTDELYGRSLDWFQSSRHPVIYTPGDNEWADCWERGSGGYAPLDRLERIRQIFFKEPTRSLGKNPLVLVSQAGREPFPEFVENARWMRDRVVFATVHIIGSKNGMKRFPARTRADDDAAKRRTEAAAWWVRETFAAATASNAVAVVISFHGNPAFEKKIGNDERQLYEPFITAIEEESEKFARPVLVAQGDDHDYIVDQPLVRRTTGRRLQNLTRLQVPGSPQVGWVRVMVTPGAENPFAFEPHVVPRWKYW